MPYYEYHCASNGRTLEVRHSMAERLSTWGEVAAKAGVDVGDTPLETPVERLMSTPVPLSGPGESDGFQGCGSGCACVPQS
jgi:hypothetical protein